MPTTDARGHKVPGTDAPNWGAFDNLSRSINDPIVVTSTADRTAKLAALAALSPAIVPSATTPIFFYRTDKTAGTELEYTEDNVTYFTIDTRSPTAWVAITAASGYTSNGAESRLEYLDGSEIVRVRGNISKNTGNLVRAVTIGTITAAHVPTVADRYSFALGNASTNANESAGVIGTDGTIQLTGDSTTLGAATVMYLGGITYARS